MPLALAVAFLCHVMWPGNTPWINDEPLLFRQALEHNRAGTWARHGLLGTRGIRYGPLPTRLYQISLRVTHDLPLIALAKSVLSMLITLVGVGGVARRLRLGHGTGLVLCATSPYLWLYHRMLWDNVWLIPLSSLLLWAAVSFMDRRRPGPLFSVALLSGVMLGIHPISAPYIAAVGATVVWHERPWLRRRWQWTLASACAFLAPVLPLIAELAAPGRPSPRVVPSLAPYFSWLFGGRVFSCFGLAYFYGADWSEALPGVLRPIACGLYWLSVTAVPLTLLGLCAMCRASVRARRGRIRLWHKVFRCVLATVVLQGIMQALFRLGWDPHYLNASWPCYLLALVYALRVLGRRAWGRVLRRGLAGVNLGCLVGLAVFLQWSGGNRTAFYGTPLANQIDVVRALGRYSRTSEVSVSVPNYAEFPHALHTLLDLYCPPAAPGLLPRRSLEVRFVSREGHSGRIELRERPSPPGSGEAGAVGGASSDRHDKGRN